MSQRTFLKATLHLLLLTCFATTCSAQTAPTPNEVEKAIRSRLTEIQAAAEALDPDKVFSFVMENNRGSLIQNGKLFLTREAALQTTKQGFRGLAQVSYRFDQQHIVLLSPTVALATGEGITTAATDAGRAITSRFAQSVVLVLVDGQWKMFHAHRSFPPRPE
jgi:ketosteroid isomerase-like protein